MQSSLKERKANKYKQKSTTPIRIDDDDDLFSISSDMSQLTAADQSSILFNFELNSTQSEPMELDSNPPNVSPVDQDTSISKSQQSVPSQQQTIQNTQDSNDTSA